MSQEGGIKDGAEGIDELGDIDGMLEAEAGDQLTALISREDISPEVMAALGRLDIKEMIAAGGIKQLLNGEIKKIRDDIGGMSPAVMVAVGPTLEKERVAPLAA